MLDYISKHKLPKTVSNAVQIIIENLSVDEFNQFRNCEEKDIHKLSREFGMIIRNTLGLWSDNTELLEDCKMYSTYKESDTSIHPYIASDIIITQVWKKINQT